MEKEKNNATEIYVAQETETSGEAFDESNELDVMLEPETKEKQNIRVSEILEFREGNRKVFRMSDGSNQAVFYPTNVHEFDEETNTFYDMDNTLNEEEDGRHFVNAKKHFVARFSKEEENDELFSVEKGTHRVTVFAKKNSKERNQGVKPEVCRKAADGIEATDAVVFAGVQSGSDYEYSVTSTGVKENIIVKEKADIYRFSFFIQQENVTAEFDESNKRISFISNETGEEVFFIPAPFMTDDNGVISTAVTYEVKNAANGNVVLNVLADSEWMNAEERAFPVVIDPQIQLNGNYAMTTYSWLNGNLSAAALNTIGSTGTSADTRSIKRMYMNLKMPTLPLNPRIKKAELTFFQFSGSSTTTCDKFPKLGLYQVTDEISIGECTPAFDSNLIDFDKMKVGYCEDGENIKYTFDVTTLVDQIDKGESNNKKLVLKFIDEEMESGNDIIIYGSGFGSSLAPQFVVTYESGYAINTSYRTHTHELGRFGQGSIDLQRGNLMFESEDFAWAGNRMPVTIKHLYNSILSFSPYTASTPIMLLTADFGGMNLGYGFKLNLMQSMEPAHFQYDGEAYDGFVYIGENAEEIHFKQSTETACINNDTKQCYHLYEDVNGDGMKYDPVKFTLKQGDDIYQFDSLGKLIKITDASGNHMDINYTGTKLTSVSDGAGRDFWFAYNDGGFLTSITAPDNTSILYGYSGDLLNMITYPDGKKVTISYTSNRPQAVTLLDAEGRNVYKVEYTFVGERVESVTEYGVENAAFVMGNKSTYSYSAASGRTVVMTTEQKDEAEGETEDNIIKTVYTFDDDGNVISEYAYTEDTGNTGVEGGGSGIHPHSGDGGMGIVSNINNLLIDHNFERLDGWTSMPGNYEGLQITNYESELSPKYGNRLLRIESDNEACVENGVYQDVGTLPVGEYTFSAYVRITSIIKEGDNAAIFIRVVDTTGKVLGVSEQITTKDGEYTRLIVPFELESTQDVQVQILVNGKCKVYADGAQLENNPYANAYNMLENSNFERDTSSWIRSSGVSTSTETCFNMSKSLCVNGAIDKQEYAYQVVPVKTRRSTRETFTLSGWAKGYGLPNHERGECVQTPTFRLRAVINYFDSQYSEYGTEQFFADFSPCTEEWQFASVQFSKSKYRTIESVNVFCDYGNNSGVAYFDDIQLVRDSIETGLVASDFVMESTGEADDSETEETTETTPGFEELKDKYGNVLTETTFTDGEFGTIYRAFRFTSDCNCAENAGNDLVCETDARGYKTMYQVNAETSRNEIVADRIGNRTEYEYDASGKTTKVTSRRPNGTEAANVSYTYDAFDNMTEIVRGDGMKYVLAYNQFHNLESIGIDGKNEKLIKYTYKNGNGRLKGMTYANGHTMKAIYNSVGQMIAEKWFETEAQAADSSSTPIAYYKYVYDGQGNIVRSLDFIARKEYSYEYEAGKIVRATECDLDIENEHILHKSVVNTIRYYYDEEDKITKKVITPARGTSQTIYYETSEDNTVVKFTAGGRTITSHSKTDSFGRKVFDELQLGTDFVSRQFVYHTGEVTQEHKANEKVKSSATTQLVSQILLSDGRILSYEYDAEERITKVTDSIEGVTEYTYDSLGQLKSETVKDVTTKFEYDNYGNITAKGVVDETGAIAEATKDTYVYGNGVWKDLLTSYNGQAIEYDAQGNPISYLGHTLTWEKGRQLKQFVKTDGTSISYTYNANGIRTSKTVNGIKHTYTLDGTKILREEWGDNSIVPLYDNEESVCGILYNDEPYYFTKNLQGDIISIVNKNGGTVARYSYDAWGVPTITEDVLPCHIAEINPYRYRGYYYDGEMGMYYLQSRYYDPAVGRFVNGDDAVLLGLSQRIIGFNLFSYCENNPINFIDITGYVVTPANVIGAVIGAVGGAVIGRAISNYFKLKWPWKSMVTASVSALLTVVGWFAGPAVYAAIKPIIIAALNAGTLMFNKIQLWVYQILGYTKNWIATQATKFLLKFASKIGQTATVASKVGRPYQNSTYLIKTIMQAVQPTFDKSLTFGLKWVVNGTFWSFNSHGTKIATQGVYELVIDVLKMRIVHFVFKS